MANMTLEEALAAATVDDDLITPVDDVIMINPETRTIIIPESEMLFGVEEEQWIERKHFKCPRIVGDNIDLSTHQIYISYVKVLDDKATISTDEKPELYWCYDVSVDETGNYITFSWELSGNVLKQRGLIGFAVIAKSMDGDVLRTCWKTSPAVGTVLMSIPDAEMEIISLYPDIVTQLLDRMNIVEDMTTEEAMQQRVNTYFDERKVEEYEALKNEAVTAVNNAGTEQKKLVESAGNSALDKISTALTNALNSIKNALSTAVNTIEELSSRKLTAIENAGTEETSKVSDEGTLQIQAVKDEGTRQKQEIEKYAGEAVDFGSQVQENTKALGGFSFSLNPDDMGLDITYTE